MVFSGVGEDLNRAKRRVTTTPNECNCCSVSAGFQRGNVVLGQASIWDRPLIPFSTKLKLL